MLILLFLAFVKSDEGSFKRELPRGHNRMRGKRELPKMVVNNY